MSVGPRQVAYPPLRLAHRVCCLEGHGEPLRAYEQLGAEAKDGLLDLLPDGWTFEGRRVLDFGCGAGRTLRHFLDEALQAEIWGTDIDADSIAWLERNLCPPLRVLRCGPRPPLQLDPGSFDLIWAQSVFTHLADSSIPWLLELHRLLAPRGLLIATYMGRWTSEMLLGEPWYEDRVGMNVVGHDRPWDAGGPSVFMSDWWVREHWGRAFEILDTRPRIQDQTWLLLRKREITLTAEDLERPSEDPREYRAVRHNIDQLRAAHAATVTELSSYYEGSRSWRLTRPLRAAARALRAVTR